MTILNIDLKDQLLESHPSDHVTIRALHLGEGPGGELLSTRPVTVRLVDGEASVDVAPGPVVVEIRCYRATVDSGPHRATVPEEGPITLLDLLRQTFRYEPAVVGQVAKMRDDAEDAANRAENVAASVHWQGDRLSVMGQLGPSLRGPKGDPGDPGDGTGGGGGDVLWSELNPVLDGKAPVSHSHSEYATTEAVEGLEAALDGKASTDHTHSQYAESSRVTALEDSQPIIVSALPSSPLPGRIYLVTG